MPIWLGRKASATIVAALREVRGADHVRIVYTAGDLSAPAVSPDGSWLWLCDLAPPAAASTQAILSGAYDVVALSEPGAADRLIARLGEIASDTETPPASPEMVGESAATKRLLREIARCARTAMPVLLTGETGTGKDVAARLIHAWSARRDKLFVAINCAAIPNELMEAELFGYAKGAFSGAVRAYDGQLVAAAGGTAFLDEIDDTPPTLQAKLLRVLEDRVVSRLGENEWRKVDFRLVAATNRDLREMIAKGQFGEDLYERLAIVSIRMPPLRERLEDLAPLALHFIERFYRDEPAARASGPVETIDPRALLAMAAHPWPGNVRELRNAIYEALVHKRAGAELLLGDLPRRILQRASTPEAPGLVDRAALVRHIEQGTMNLRRETEALERIALSEALSRAGGSPAGAAKLLGEVGRGASRDPSGTVRAMMRRLGVIPSGGT